MLQSKGASWLGRTAHACQNGRPNERPTARRPERRSRLRGHDDRRSRRHGARAWAGCARPSPGDGAPRSGGSTPATRPAGSLAGVLISQSAGREHHRSVAALPSSLSTASSLASPASQTAPFVPATRFASGLSPSFAPAPNEGWMERRDGAGCLRGTPGVLRHAEALARRLASPCDRERAPLGAPTVAILGLRVRASGSVILLRSACSDAPRGRVLVSGERFPCLPRLPVTSRSRGTPLPAPSAERLRKTPLGEQG